MAKFHGSVAQAIHGLARNTVTAAADKAKLSLASSVGLFEKAWSDSHLFGLLVTLLYLEVALAVLVAFGASHDQSLEWAFKQYLDNFADACSIVTIALSLYGNYLIQFNFRVLYDRGALVAEFTERHGISSNLLFGFMMTVLAYSSVVVVAIASFAYYFGSGRTFGEYLQRYADEVADVCSIVCIADWGAFCMAFAAANGQLHVMRKGVKEAVAENERKRIYNRIYRKRFCQIALAWATAIVAVSQYIAPSSVKQHGFFAVAKDYLDEAADIASICMFALFLSSILSAQALVSRLFDGLRGDGTHTPGARICPRSAAFVAVVAITAAAFSILKATTETPLPPYADLFKHHLDEVADVCSIFTVLGFIYYNQRLSSLTSSLNQALEQHVQDDALATPRLHRTR